MTLIDNKPIGRRTVHGFACGPHGCVTEWKEDEYAPGDIARGQRLREFRVSLDLSLREAANHLGVTHVQAAELERGRKWFATPDDEAMAMRTLAKAGAK